VMNVESVSTSVFAERLAVEVVLKGSLLVVGVVPRPVLLAV
jgi:hypothetical protein